MLGPSTLAIVSAAHQRGIPIMRISEHRSLVQLGYGKWARWIQASETSKTPNLSVEIAQDKELTKELLGRVGVPVPTGDVIEEVDDAWPAAQRIGLPVVVKPKDGNQGKARQRQPGHARSRSSPPPSWPSSTMARSSSSASCPGNDFRLLVVNDRLVAAAQRDPAQVVGDGQHTIRATGRHGQRRPAPGRRPRQRLTTHPPGRARRADADASRSCTWDSVPAPGQRCCCATTANLSTGGTATDVTDDVHPDNRRHGRAGRPHAGPGHRRHGRGLRAHRPPAGRAGRRHRRGQRRARPADAPRARRRASAAPVGEAIVDMLFQPRAAPAACRSSPSPASTARRPSRA